MMTIKKFKMMWNENEQIVKTVIMKNDNKRRIYNTMESESV